MALNAPNCKDTQEVQFKLHDKFVAFKKCGDLRSSVKLLAVSSSRDLLFAGSPTAPELKVVIIKDVVAAKTSGKQPKARRVALPHIPNYMSCSADGNLLAINSTQENGTSLLHIYGVQSFLTPDIRPLYIIRLAPEDFVHAVQLLWNPVLPNSLAVILSNGGLVIYVLKEGGNFEVHSLDKSQQVKCGCWSPKGKQLVLGFPNGKLQQYKPDLTPAKTLACPPNVHAAPFDTIAVHWLSTFQFAVIFLQQGVDCNPALYIINSPKAGAPTYTNYYDICYSLNGPRSHQFHFTHVQQWNLLLVSSANGVEVGVLGTTETGDTPTWQQLTLLDEARIELPLSEETQDETFPLGFVFDTSSSHQLIINEQQLPSMPMVHVLGTDGTLLTFNFLNLQPGAASVCSPPPPVTDTSGQFHALNTLLDAEQQPAAGADAGTAPTASAEPNTPALADISFAFTPNTVTSTPAPAKEKPASLFAGFGSGAGSKPQTSSTFAAPSFPSAPLNFAAASKPMPAVSFGGFGGSTANAAPATAPRTILTNAAPSFGQFDKPAAVAPATAAVPADPLQLTASVASPAAPMKTNNSKPLYTVPPTFTPAASAAPAAVAPAAAMKSTIIAGKSSDISAREIDDVIAEIMSVQINSFSSQIEQQKQQTRALLSQIESPSSIKFYAKRLDDLQELNDQANDVEFELDVQGLRHALSEAYAMMAECRAKLDVYRNPDITRLMSSTSFDAAGRRSLSRLQSYLSANEAQLRLAQQHIDTQWEQYQDVLRRNSKSKMHMPCLEGIYQRLTRLQNLASDQRIKQTNIKAKLKDRGLLQSSLISQEHSRQRNNEAVDTLADSILSMSLNQVVDSNRAKLSAQKLQSIRNLLQSHKIQIISPQRPDRVGLKSEVILETKLKAEQNRKAAAAANVKPATAHKATQAATITAPTPAVVPTQLSKSVTVAAVEKTHKPAPAPAAAAPAAVVVPALNPTAAPAAPAAPFSFFQNTTPFSKSTAVTASTKAGDAVKPATNVSGSVFSFSSNQQGAEKPALSFGAPSPAPAAMSTNLFAGFGAPSMDATKPKATTATVEKPKETTVKPLFESKKESEIKPTVIEPQISSSNTAVTKTAAGGEPVNKPFSFAGFGSNTNTIGSSTFKLGGFGSSLGNAAAPSVPTTGVTTTAGAVKPEAAVSSSSTTTATTMPTATLSFGKATAPPNGSGSGGGKELTTDNFFGSVNICKPQVKDKVQDAPPSNVFSGFGQSASTPAATTAGGLQLGDASKGLFGSSSAVSAADGSKTTFSFGTTATAAFGAPPTTTTSAPTVAATSAPTIVTTAAPATFGTSPATPAATTGATVVTTASPTVAATTAATFAATTTTTAAATVAVPAAAATASTAAPGSSFSFSNAFSSLSTASSTPAGTLTETSSATSTTSNASTFVFGGGNAFGAAPTVASPFQAAAATTAAAPPAANLFGSVPKPEASVFGAATVPAATAAAPPTGLFASAAASSSPSPFGGSPAAAPAATATSGGNIFAQAAAATAAVNPSGFGSAVVSPTPAGGSIFGGGSNASPFGGGSIFGGGNSAQSPQPAASTGSIFGQSVIGASATPTGGNLFSSASPSQPPSTGFGSGGSVFGGAASNATSPAASGGSIFGGGSTSSVGFGSFAQVTPATGGFGSSGFAQTTGASVAQTGFGSPQQQQQTQQSPAGGFGAKPVFGGSPAFGASPTFGGAPTFGSPKGFGNFGNTPGVVAPAFGAQPKPAEGNIFETLGGTDAGLSFGNLAQTGNSNQQKSSFGGSSFMTYR